jgi:hypothetical protein
MNSQSLLIADRSDVMAVYRMLSATDAGPDMRIALSIPSRQHSS